jgi:hypothetical protein
MDWPEENVHDTRIVIKRRSEPEFPIHCRTANDFENLLEHFKSQQPIANREIWCETHTPPAADGVLSVRWEYWRMTESQARYRGAPNVIDLGDLDIQ